MGVTADVPILNPSPTGNIPQQGREVGLLRLTQPLFPPLLFSSYPVTGSHPPNTEQPS